MQKYTTFLKRILSALLIIACCAYVALFCIKNSTLVDIDLLFVQLPAVKIELALVASFIAGGLTGLMSALPFLLGMHKKYRRDLKAR